MKDYLEKIDTHLTDGLVEEMRIQPKYDNDKNLVSLSISVIPKMKTEFISLEVSTQEIPKEDSNKSVKHILSNVNHTDSNGKKQGRWIFNYSSPNGIFVHNSIYYKDNEKDGVCTDFWKDKLPSSIIEYSNGKMEGIARYYHINGSLMAEGYFSNNKKHGVWKCYDINKALVRTVNYKNGIINE